MLKHNCVSTRILNLVNKSLEIGIWLNFFFVITMVYGNKLKERWTATGESFCLPVRNSLCVASQHMGRSNDDSDNINDSYNSDGSNHSYKCCRFSNFLVSHHKPTYKNYVWPQNSTCTNFAGCLTEAIVTSSRKFHRRWMSPLVCHNLYAVGKPVYFHFIIATF